VTSEDTGLAVELVTSRDGNYSFYPVKVGTYTLEVEFENFKKTVQRHVSVDVQQVVGANFSFTPGSIVETGVVTAVAPLLQTQEASVGTVATTAMCSSAAREAGAPKPTCHHRRRQDRTFSVPTASSVWPVLN